MSTPCSKYESLIAEALFGELSDEDRQRLEAHVETCDACAEELRSLQATLAVTAQRERPEPPESFWQNYGPRLVRRMRRAEARTVATPSLRERLAAWWQHLIEVPPAMRWALQGAVAVVLVAVGFGLGRQQAAPSAGPGSDTELFANTETITDATLATLISAEQPIESEHGTIRPHLANVRNITYDVQQGTVEIRYNTVNDIVIRGKPDDPAVQRLLRTAMLDEQNPSAQLNALQMVEQTSASADPELVQALTYLAKTEADPNMRFRAVRALRSLHNDAPMSEDTRDVLINILLSGTNSALRIEALQALTESPSQASPDYLYEVRNDSNSYVRYQAQQTLQTLNLETASLDTF